MTKRKDFSKTSLHSNNPYSKLYSKTRKKVQDFEKEHELYLGELIKEYGIVFVLSLIKLSTKRHRPEIKKIEMIWPEKVKEASQKKDRNIFNDNFDEYIGKIEEAGFRLCKKYEPFVDEDTGEPCVIHRHYIYFLNNN